MMEIRLRWGEVDGAVRVSRGIKVTHSPYGWDFRDGTSEWQISVRWTTRQDGNTAWGIMMTEVDGDCRRIGGLTPTGDETFRAMEGAINKLTRKAGWREPINGKVELKWT